MRTAKVFGQLTVLLLGLAVIAWAGTTNFSAVQLEPTSEDSVAFRVLNTSATPVFSISNAGIVTARFPGRGSFTVCGDLTTINNNTVYYGPSMALVESATVGLARTCNTAATGSTTEATADTPAYTATAFQILAMDCIAQDAGATVSFTARTAAGATVPSVTCSVADNELGCVANTQTTTAIASAATFAIAAASTADMGDVQFICTVNVAF